MAAQVCYTGPFLDASGYGEANRNAIVALYEAGADIKTERVSFTGTKQYTTRASKIANELASRNTDYKIKIIHTTPDVYEKYMEQGKYHIGHLFWETDKLPTSWVAPCNKMDEIWTGTKLNADASINSGVTVPVYVFPQSVDTDVPDVRKYRLPNFNGKLFYSIFEWNERKNPKVLLNAFWKEFKGDFNVGLLVKVHKGAYTEFGVQEILNDIKGWKNSLGFKDTPRLFVCTNMLDEFEKHRLHETGDIYVTTHRGEGWALPVAEACLHRKLVISPKYGGICEYMTPKHFMPVPHTLTPIDKIYHKYYEPGMNWADVKEEDVRRVMRKSYEYLDKDGGNKGAAAIKAGSARNLVANSFSYKMVGGTMVLRLQKILEKL